jgi:predicted amidohydrolase
MPGPAGRAEKRQMQPKSPFLKIALIHLAPEAGRPEANLAGFLSLAREAAQNGARLVAAPEMCISGYCFESREEIAPLTQTADGPVMQAVRDLARGWQIHIIFGMAEREEPGSIFYNSAFLINDQGRISGRVRKINSESRWACPGSQFQDNIFETPWGRAAVHICADSWNSLILRISAVKGADLIILPANWPPSGMDPAELWQFRAWENGLWFAACNRTGIDGTFDCTPAESLVCDPEGRVIQRGRSRSSRIFYAEIPLNREGRFDSPRRRTIMARRTPERCHRLYGNFTGIKDLTGFLKLPLPGLLDVRVIMPDFGQNPADFLERIEGSLPPEALLVLPQFPYFSSDLEKIEKAAGSRLAVSRFGFLKPDWVVLGGGTAVRRLSLGGLNFADYGPARLWLAEAEEIVQPEAALAAAKTGADLAVSFVPSLTKEMKMLAAMRPIDQLAVCLAAPDGAAAGLMYQGHSSGEGLAADPGECGQITVDTALTREKRFQDRLDFTALFQPDPDRP